MVYLSLSILGLFSAIIARVILENYNNRWREAIKANELFPELEEGMVYNFNGYQLWSNILVILLWVSLINLCVAGLHYHFPNEF